MPSTAVYFAALPLSIAWIAARLMFCGVSKSGSPAPKPITSRPAALSARALSVTAMVADGWMRLRYCASMAMDVSRHRPLSSGATLLEAQPESGKRTAADQSHVSALSFQQSVADPHPTLNPPLSLR